MFISLLFLKILRKEKMDPGTWIHHVPYLTFHPSILISSLTWSGWGDLFFRLPLVAAETQTPSLRFVRLFKSRNVDPPRSLLDVSSIYPDIQLNLVGMGGFVLPSPFGRCRDADSFASLRPSFQIPERGSTTFPT